MWSVLLECYFPIVVSTKKNFFHFVQVDYFVHRVDDLERTLAESILMMADLNLDNDELRTQAEKHLQEINILQLENVEAVRIQQERHAEEVIALEADIKRNLDEREILM